MDSVHQINSYICLVSGITLNSLLIWLIWKKTNGGVRRYSFILLQGCIVDLIYLILASIVQPVILINGGDVLFSQFGIFRYFSRSVNCITIYIWIYAFNFTKFSPLIQFYYRYLVICRERQVSWTNLLPSLLLIILLPFIVAALCSLANDDTPESFQQIEDIFHASQNNYSVALFFPQRSNILLWAACAIIVFDFIVYKLVIWLAYKIWCTLRISLNQITTESRSQVLNKQINFALLVQVFVPVIVSSIPVIYLAHSAITKSGVVTICQLMTIPLHWIPVLNPISTILIIKQYSSSLKCCRKDNQRVFNSTSRATA
ncbi:serpentine type 7TM GPCR chemoreceptor srd domain-containing protein [Ditylenchus destructor]|uniref:Serpentine type 7TM GPCR chemoreceptor srd domain-containing protein n=1 Tax=Ditylenchus destructor TaxID=166010 RepID=A0AAD4NAH1_9BILA|nr:serpentine type 7TM GPCR chemoreceptor srd domain-containing protein [Ditylenchus destructor]